MRSNSMFRSRAFKRTVLAVALSSTLAGGVAFAQSTTGSIFGQAPAATGETVTISGNGINRQTTVDASGRYTFGTLPTGTYTVNLVRDGAVVDSRKDVAIRIGAGTEVSFAAGNSPSGAQTLEGVTVSAASLPAIDVSAVDSRTVITSKQLQQLPLGRSAEAIALLAPGVVSGSNGGGNFASPTGGRLVSFAGSSVVENAYYINGMNVTDPLNGMGGITLPYGSIDQQEILTGGYSAAYGRSDGGVISQVGKRGTNEWHFGGQLLYTPKSLRGDPKNVYQPSDGSLYQYREDNKGWTAVESAYAGGPLIKDKLFFFGSVEAERTHDQNVAVNSSPSSVTERRYSDPKYYAKLDWNINDSNILELTGAGTKEEFNGNTYVYDYDTLSKGDFTNQATHFKNAANMWIAKYTGYLTDDLTLTAQFGKQVTDYYEQLGDSYNPDLIYISSPVNQDPALNGGRPGGIRNAQTVIQANDPKHQTRGANYRIDLTYKLGDHSIAAGIDNQRTQDLDDGATMAGNAGFMYRYYTHAPDTDILAGRVGPPGGNGYYVTKYIQESAASVRVDQRAQYLEDTWQVSDRWLLKLGIRNDQFTNYNSDNQPYIRQHNRQWAPRLGASWDVNGDSTFKVYANAGRYYLALPTSVALRGASGSTYTEQYYTYTGIDPTNGYPTGLTPIQTEKGPGAPISANNEYGQAPDPKTVTSKSLKAQYQDEYILGFDKALNDQWNYGAKATYRSLKNAIDDTCNIQLFEERAEEQGLPTDNLRGCYFFNPGRAVDFTVADGNGGFQDLHINNHDLGFPHVKRNYYGLNMYLEHPFDGTWFGRIDYTYSKSYGNTEGQVKSDIGQADIAATQDWDYPELMDYSNGLLPNDRKHVFKIYGGYQVTPEILVSANVSLSSGAPKSCQGFYGPLESSPAYPGNYYHFCGGVPSPAGSAGRTPWQHIFSLNAEYRPDFADKKLAFNVLVYNLLNERKPNYYDPAFGTIAEPEPTYNLPGGTGTPDFETPRYVQFGITYDF
ncbi:TonB-dependent receptor [Pinirhizobacter sp.]|uniref:TonB-dependent receptor n=1 Tax=Pinirhizobacter sp. TaxID=2950432 RepID=UPI002F3F58CF